MPAMVSAAAAADRPTRGVCRGMASRVSQGLSHLGSISKKKSSNATQLGGRSIEASPPRSLAAGHRAITMFR